MTQNVDANTNKASTSGAVESPRLDEVEKEVKKLKADVEDFMGLKNTVDDLKNTIADIRTLISEAQNPSNLLQLITREDDSSNVIQTKPLIEKGLLVDKAVGKITEATKAAVPSGFAVESTMEAKGSAHMEKAAACETERVEKVVEFPSTSEEPFANETQSHSRHERVNVTNLYSDTSIVHWVYTMLDLGFDAKNIQKLCDYCEYAGFMPKGYSVQVSNLVGAIVKARSRNLSPEELILSMHAAAEAAGVKKNSADLKGLIISVLKKSKADKCNSRCERPRS
jgi:hypothetical protein